MSTSFKGLTITVGADTKQFNKEMKKVDGSIRGTNRQVSELQKGLELNFDAGRFAEAQKLAQKAIQETEMKAQALRGQLKHLEDTGADTQSAQYKKLQTELIKTENQAVLLKDKLEQIKNMKIEALAKQFEKVGAGFTKAGQALAPFSAAAAGTLVGLGAIGKSTIKTADDLKTFADRVNLSAEELQKWQYIAMQTDVSNDELQMGLTKAQGAFASLAKGDVDVVSKALMELGFSAEEASKGMGANFDELVNNLSSIEDPLIQAAYANEIFGERMGSKLIPMLKAGGDGLAQLAQEFESFGTLTNEQIESLADFDNIMNDISYSFKTIKDQVGAALLPVMQSLADFLNSRVIPAVRSLADWFNNLTIGQKNALLGTLAFVAALAPALIIIGKLTTGIGGVVKAVGGLSKALTLLSAHPIIAIIGLIAVLIGVLYTQNEQFRESINGLISTIGSALMPILQTVGALFKRLLDAVMPLLDIMAQAFVPIIDTLAEALAPLIEMLGGLLMPILSIMMPIIENQIGLFIKIAEVIMKLLVPVIKFLGDILTSVFEAIPGIINNILKFIEKVVNSVIDFINGLIRQINKLGNVLGFTIGELDRVHLEANFGNSKTPETKTQIEETPSASDAISTSPTTTAPSYVTNNDYSNKDVVINVTVENFAERVDVDDLARQVNLKLAESL